MVDRIRFGIGAASESGPLRNQNRVVEVQDEVRRIALAPALGVARLDLEVLETRVLVLDGNQPQSKRAEVVAAEFDPVDDIRERVEGVTGNCRVCVGARIEGQGCAARSRVRRRRSCGRVR